MLKQMEEHSLIVRSLLVDETANITAAVNTFVAMGLYRRDAHGNPTVLNRELILKHLKKDRGSTLRGHYGMGRGAFILLMRMMLENT